MPKRTSKKTEWTPVINEQFRLSCEITHAIYEKSNKPPSSFEEFENLVFKHFDNGIAWTLQSLAFTPDMKEELKQTAEAAKRDFKKGSRLDLQKMVKDSFDTLSIKPA
jgi:hypothetical protein